MASRREVYAFIALVFSGFGVTPRNLEVKAANATLEAAVNETGSPLMASTTSRTAALEGLKNDSSFSTIDAAKNDPGLIADGMTDNTHQILLGADHRPEPGGNGHNETTLAVEAKPFPAPHPIRAPLSPETPNAFSEIYARESQGLPPPTSVRVPKCCPVGTAALPVAKPVKLTELFPSFDIFCVPLPAHQAEDQRHAGWSWLGKMVELGDNILNRKTTGAGGGADEEADGISGLTPEELGWIRLKEVGRRPELEVVVGLPHCSRRSLVHPHLPDEDEFYVYKDGYLERFDSSIQAPGTYCLDTFVLDSNPPVNPAEENKTYRAAIVCEDIDWRPPVYAFHRIRPYGYPKLLNYSFPKCCEVNEILDASKGECVPLDPELPPPVFFPVTDARNGRYLPLSKVNPVLEANVLGRNFLNSRYYNQPACSEITFLLHQQFHLLETGELLIPNYDGVHTATAHPHTFCVDASVASYDSESSKFVREILRGEGQWDDTPDSVKSYVRAFVGVLCDENDWLLERIRNERLDLFDTRCQAAGANSACIAKCCPFGTRLVGLGHLDMSSDVQTGEKCLPLRENETDWTPVFHVRKPDGGFEKVDLSPDEYTIVDDLKPICGRNYTLDTEDEHVLAFRPVLSGPRKKTFRVLANGDLLRRISKSDWQRHRSPAFCVDYYVDPEREEVLEMALFCHYEPSRIGRNRGMAYGLIASTLFLLLTLVVLLKSARSDGSRLANLTLVTYIVSLMVSTGLVAGRNMSDLKFTETQCVAIASSIYFSRIAAHLWICVMSFDIWNSLRKTQRSSSKNVASRLLLRSLLAFGVPAVMTGILLILQYCVDPRSYLGAPISRQYKLACDFGTTHAIISLYYAPLAVAQFASIVFFTLTAKLVHAHSKNLRSLKIQNDQKTTFLLISKLFVIMCLGWASNMAGWLVAFNRPDVIKKLKDVVSVALAVLSSVAIFLVYLCRASTLKEIRRRSTAAARVVRRRLGLKSRRRRRSRRPRAHHAGDGDGDGDGDGKGGRRGSDVSDSTAAAAASSELRRGSYTDSTFSVKTEATSVSMASLTPNLPPRGAACSSAASTATSSTRDGRLSVPPRDGR